MTVLKYSKGWDKATSTMEMFIACQTAAATLIRYSNAYIIPSIIAFNYFNQVEQRRFWGRPFEENLVAYLKLGTMNLELAGQAHKGDMQAIDQFLAMELKSLFSALTTDDPKAWGDFVQRMQRLSDIVAYTYPEAISGIESEFGFHLERQPASSCIDETDRFKLYQVLPTENKSAAREAGKPILIIPPFVLGANILSFLPMEKRSYAHAFANQGFPTYIRIAKNIQTTEAVQIMTPEDDAVDTRQFCQIIKNRHGLPLTLNGYCQGGFTALCNLLSGELDGLVDAFITCVSPMDGSRGKGLAKFLKKLPEIFNDLAYGTKTLPNGSKVADGTLMGWVYKLKSIETETPMLSMWRDMMLLSKGNSEPSSINKTALALNYWLIRDRNDLALNMTHVSFESFNNPIGRDGTLPVKLFGKPLNLKRIQEKNIPWLICYGKQDDLVEPATALAPTDYVNAEVTGFPKGHVAIATSWSHPESSYALHKHYPDEGTRGPVRFQMDLQDAIDQARKPAPQIKKIEDLKTPAPGTADSKGASVVNRESGKPAVKRDKKVPGTKSKKMASAAKASPKKSGKSKAVKTGPNKK